MRQALAAILAVAVGASPDGGAGEGLVEAAAVVPGLAVDLRYATADNFMKKQVYPASARCLLLERSAQMLARAANGLRSRGFRLVAHDCYRPHSVQAELWKVMPVPGYVADPKRGSNHSRGGAVDVTLVALDGGAVEMPSPYDFFGRQAHHGYDGGTPASRAHREALREAMVGAGFTVNPKEWWHYDVPGASRLPLRDEPFAAP